MHHPGPRPLLEWLSHRTVFIFVHGRESAVKEPRWRVLWPCTQTNLQFRRQTIQSVYPGAMSNEIYYSNLSRSDESSVPILGTSLPVRKSTLNLKPPHSFNLPSNNTYTQTMKTFNLKHLVVLAVFHFSLTSAAALPEAKATPHMWCDDANIAYQHYIRECPADGGSAGFSRANSQPLALPPCVQMHNRCIWHGMECLR
jgi:hypothetical protein